MHSATLPGQIILPAFEVMDGTQNSRPEAAHSVSLYWEGPGKSAMLGHQALDESE